MRPITTNPPALMLAAGLALIGCAGSASAQYALGDGRVLDNNLRQNSGGYNSAGRNFGAEIAFRNAIVTGNVAGGREFRGSVGYTAADDFRGFLGSNTNYQFERDSFYSGLATRNLTGIDAIRNPLAYTVAGQSETVFGGPLIINRSGAATSAGDVPPNASTKATDVYGNIAGTLRAPSVQITRADRLPEMLAYTGEPDAFGVTQIMSASPLMGIKALRSDNASFNPNPRHDLDRRREESAILGGLPTNQADPEEEAIVRSPHQVVLESLRGPALAEPFGAVPVGAPIGGPNIIGAPTPTIEAPASPTPSTVVPPAESPELEGAAAPNPLVVPAFDQGLDNLRILLRDVRAERTDADTAANDADTAQAREEAANTDTGDDADEPRKTAPQLAAEILKGKSALIIDLAAPPSEGAIFAEHMRRGQTLLIEERWFDAEERFTAALAVRPGDPIAAAARVNAQIAGGMYRSASVNLRNLFRAYPEMIVTRFDVELIGPPKRTDKVKAQLRQRAEQETHLAREAALLLAYIAYQTQDQPTIVEAFTRVDAIGAARGTTPDDLEQTLRAVWLSSPQPSAPTPQPTPQPATPPAPTPAP